MEGVFHQDIDLFEKVEVLKFVSHRCQERPRSHAIYDSVIIR